jgi:hypothetical protein
VLNDLAGGGNALISAAQNAVRVHVIAVDEEATFARAATGLLGRDRPGTVLPDAGVIG